MFPSHLPFPPHKAAGDGSHNWNCRAPATLCCLHGPMKACYRFAVQSQDLMALIITVLKQGVRKRSFLEPQSVTAATRLIGASPTSGRRASCFLL